MITEPRLFTDLDTWLGGFYELAIELGARSDERLEAALAVLWQNPSVQGCYERSDIEPSSQPCVLPTLARQERGHLRGIATLPNGKLIACGTFKVREDDGSDWLGFYLPMGALATAYDVGAYPIVDGSSPRFWREPLNEWLASMAQSVYAAVPFVLALIGHEVSGSAYATDVKSTGVPDEHWTGYLWQEGDRLIWYPPTHYEGHFDF